MAGTHRLAGASFQLMCSRLSIRIKVLFESWLLKMNRLDRHIIPAQRIVRTQYDRLDLSDGVDNL
jgi:hypothetical protein